LRLNAIGIKRSEVPVAPSESLFIGGAAARWSARLTDTDDSLG
jgi:hypothetical protein